jgi:hypothetical protein
MIATELCIAFVATAIFSCTLLSVPVRRVSDRYWKLLVYKVFTYCAEIFHRTPQQQATTESLRETRYLTPARGFTAHLTSQRRIQLWHQAVQYCSRILRLRKRWALLGHRLQEPRIQFAVAGLDRQKGQLRRSHNADTGIKIATAKAKQRASRSSAAPPS